MLRLPYRHTVSTFIRSEICTRLPSRNLRVRCVSRSISSSSVLPTFCIATVRRWCNFYDEEWPETPYKMPDALWTPAEVSAVLFHFFGEPMGAIEYLASNKPREIGATPEEPVPEKSIKPFAA